VGTTLHVRNLPVGMTDNDLQRLFAAHGTVHAAQVITPRETGRSQGFGLVEMASAEQAQAARAALNGHEVGGRPLAVNEAPPRDDRGGSSRGGAGFGGSRRG
jgi:RNA recognition motif-containing protein